MVNSLKCPNCHESYDTTSSICEKCGSNYTNNDQANSGEKRYFKKLLLKANEQPIRSGVGNLYYSAVKSDGGKLYLTNQRLVFMAHKANLNPNLFWEIHLNDIRNITMKRNLFVSQHIAVESMTGEETIFVVYKGKKWINEVLTAKSN